jgi:cytidine deaminase
VEPAVREDLIARAREALGAARAPYSHFKVGAALLAADGSVFGGCNIENPSLMLSMCAERVALYKALSEGAGPFRAMAIVSSDGGVCYPCGSCRQVLREFAPGLVLLLSSEEGVRTLTVEELLPDPFVRDP